MSEADIWRKHPGLGGADGIGGPCVNGVTRWYTVEQARVVIEKLQAGIDVLAPESGTSE